MVVRCRRVGTTDVAIEVLGRGGSEFTVKLRLRTSNYYTFVEAVKCRFHRLLPYRVNVKQKIAYGNPSHVRLLQSSGRSYLPTLGILLPPQCVSTAASEPDQGHTDRLPCIVLSNSWKHFRSIADNSETIPNYYPETPMSPGGILHSP